MSKPKQGYRRLTAFREMLAVEAGICLIAAATAIIRPEGAVHVVSVFAAAAGAVGLAFSVYAGGDAYGKAKAPESMEVKE